MAGIQDYAGLQALVVEHLAQIYPDIDCNGLAAQLLEALAADHIDLNNARTNHWDQSDVVAITYGNTIIDRDQKPLATLYEFLSDQLRDTVSTIHILPFFPYSSDDGFAVMDYSSVNESLGNWSHIKRIADTFTVMGDLVINHASSRSRWFENFKRGIDPGREYFVVADDNTDVSKVVRPRTSELLVAVETHDGPARVWCTFGPDQVDMNFANPQVLIEFVRIISDYLSRGITWFRLDAVAFLWKESGSPCVHLPQTHELIKLLRLLIDAKRPGSVVITETNVPNRENLTYFGNGNEAHLIYNFSLPPLMVHTLISGDCRHLKTWQMSMPPAQQGTAYLNFIASHDGIGVRPAEGLLTEDELESLIDTMLSFGGEVTYRQSGGSERSPYEINIALIDALKGTTANGPDAFQFERFVCAHTIMLALEGIPAFYIHSLLATENDHARVEHTGRLRSINRHQWDRDALQRSLSDSASLHHQVFNELRRRIRIRKRQPAFHPNATQYTLHLGQEIFGFWRQSFHREQSIFAISNVTHVTQQVHLSELNLIGTDSWFDLITDSAIPDIMATYDLAPYQTLWLTNLRPSN